MGRNEKGQLRVINLESTIQKCCLPEGMEQSKAFKSQELLCAAFAPKKEDLIAALTGEPEMSVVFWDTNRQNLLGVYRVNRPIVEGPSSFMLSFNPFDTKSDSFVITGPELYQYVRKDIEMKFEVEV